MTGKRPLRERSYGSDRATAIGRPRYKGDWETKSSVSGDAMVERVSKLSVHDADHVRTAAASPFRPAVDDLIRIGSRRWFLQTGLAGLGGLSMAQILAAQSSRPVERNSADRKSVILFWLSGGPSHIDMWDPKPDAPSEIRGPYAPISTRIPGVHVLRASALAGIDHATSCR